MARIDLTGQTFGKLAVIRYDHQRKDYSLYWLCKCECGVEKVISGHSMKTGMQKSCGCERNKTQFKRTHYRSGSFEYICWLGMKARCKNSDGKHQQYVDKGITVCKRWDDSFEAFLSDIGEAPTKKHTVERINNNGNYEPSNCKWATRKEQNRNLSTNRILEFDGKSMCVADWADELGFYPDLLYCRLSMGWSIEKTLTTPKRKRKTPVKKLDL